VQLGMIGRAPMDANMVRRLIRKGHSCVVFDRSPQTVAELVQEHAIGADSLIDLVKKLAEPSGVWLMVPAAVVDQTIADLLTYLAPGDILIDGGNSTTSMTFSGQTISLPRRFFMSTLAQAAASEVWNVDIAW
jgi:6-phosphogluconate dehydrogenase